MKPGVTFSLANSYQINEHGKQNGCFDDNGDGNEDYGDDAKYLFIKWLSYLQVKVTNIFKHQRFLITIKFKPSSIYKSLRLFLCTCYRNVS